MRPAQNWGGVRLGLVAVGQEEGVEWGGFVGEGGAGGGGGGLQERRGGGGRGGGGPPGWGGRGGGGGGGAGGGVLREPLLGGVEPAELRLGREHHRVAHQRAGEGRGIRAFGRPLRLGQPPQLLHRRTP